MPYNNDIPLAAGFFLSLVIIGLILPQAVHASQRQLLTHQGIRVVVDEGEDWCGESVDVRLLSDSKADFSDNRRMLEKLLGGIRATMGFECPQVSHINLVGMVDTLRVYEGYASATEGWRLNSEYLPEQPEPSASPSASSQSEPEPETAPASTQPGVEVSPTTAPRSQDNGPGSTGSSWWIWFFLLIPAGGAIWWYVFRKPAAATPSDTQPGEQSVNQPRSADAREAPSKEMEDLPEEEDEQWESNSSSATYLTEADADDLLSVQRAKYQARLSEAADKLTQARMEYQKRQSGTKEIQKAIQKFGDALSANTRSALAARFGSARKALLRAVTLSALWRLFRRLPIGFKLVIVGAILWATYGTYDQYKYYSPEYLAQEALGLLLVILAIYAATVALLFFYEKRALVTGGYKAMKMHAGNLKKVELWHFYRSQGFQDQHYKAMSLSPSRSTGPETERLFPVNGTVAKQSLAGRGMINLLNDKSFCCYALSDEKLAGGLLSWDTENEFMKSYGQVLVDSLSEIESQIHEDYQQLRGLAEALWKIRRLEDEIPRIENLIRNVETLEQIWRNISVSDDVFDFLLKRIDLFNLGDKAVPAGILLYGYPGNGKRFLAEMIARSVGASFVEITASDMRNADEVKGIWEKYRNALNTVLFIDNAEQIFAKPGSEHADGASKEITLAWTDEWARLNPAQQRVWIVLSAQNEQDLHSSILSRLGSSKIEIKAPDEAGRRLILQQACKEHEVPLPVPDDVVKNTNGASVRELRDIVAEVRLQSYPGTPTPDQWKQSIVSVRGADASIRDETKTWDRLILPAAIKEQLRSITRILVQAEQFRKHGIEPPKGLLLYGPPGTGKTEIARTLANESGLQFIAASTADMKGQYIGQSGQMVREVFARARANAPSILFIDEIESIAANRSSSDADTFTKEIVTQLLQEMDGIQKNERHVFVLAATNIPDSIDAAILSRFRNKLEIPLPDVEGRREILRAMLQSRLNNPTFDIDEAAIKLARQLRNKSGRDLRNFIDRALEREVMRAGSPDDINLSIESLIEEAIAMQGDNAFKDASKTWDRLVLPVDIKEQLQNITRILVDAEKFQQKGVEAPKAILLFGPPGTGKTEIARTLANESGLEFMSASTADMKAGYIGQSGQLVKNVFANARANAPCILFIDEIESIAAKRGSRLADQFTQEIVTQMLQEMDGIQKQGGKEAHVFVLAATNMPETIDSAINSRFTARIEIPLPDEAGRRDILRGLLGTRVFNASFDIDEAAEKLASVLKGKSGRDLKNFVNRALEREALRAGSPDEINLTLAGLMDEAMPKANEITDDELSRVWSRMVLPPTVKDSVINKIRMFNRADPAAPKGLLLYGPPGTGKTEIARRIADSTGGHFMSLSIPDLKAGHVGGSGERVRKIWEEARDRGRAVIFVDECEGMFARRGSVNSDAASDELVQAFLAEWDGVASSDQIWVVGATNRRDLLDEAIVSRFGAAVEIGLPDADGRKQILKLEMEKLGREPDIPEHVGNATNGFSGRNLATLARDICTLAAEKGEIGDDDWNATIRQQTGAISDKVSDDAHWDSLIIDNETLDKLQTVCGMLQHIEVLQEQGVKPPRGMLLYGPPGTGKTQIARTLANESGVQFIAAATADLKAGYVGQSGQKVKEVFERARSRAPSILFIDEMESVAPSRNSSGSDQFTQEIVTQMLQELDGVKSNDAHVFLLAATNIPDAIDSAILSRLPEKIQIPLPGEAERERLFALFLKDIKNTRFDVETATRILASHYSRVSGRDIRGIVDNAQQKAVRRALQEGTPDNIVVFMEDLGIDQQTADES
ncbi:AAA family ATPase [Marinobacter sp. TBZ242]|uniref:AAA family ATPase n=1 Tax=Marinobacter azerbaijanicus TaxID=3050455 RepID=A0ABT7I9H3_9GAMM|nr:ATP-binding protein [Marinobacter sp. TBZ242]MDL0429809.1 AAA family ATPase [Marinobacter sp. TBZ242]